MELQWDGQDKNNKVQSNNKYAPDIGYCIWNGGKVLLNPSWYKYIFLYLSVQGLYGVTHSVLFYFCVLVDILPWITTHNFYVFCWIINKQTNNYIIRHLLHW